VVNADDSLGIEIEKKHQKAISYAIENPADVFAMDVKQTKKGLSLILNLFDCVYNLEIPLTGMFNVYNALASATVCALVGVKTDKIVSALKKIKGVSGRMQKVYGEDFSVFIDYAHTPDGLEKVLTALKKDITGKLICVFGCGGNRDQGKRKEMGRVSGSIADFSVITSDNSRFEEPMEIMSEIEKGVLEVSKKYVLIQDRYQATKYAIDMAKAGDVIILAGKGSEKYQEVLGIKKPYNDKDSVEEILKNFYGE
jgi:UDP-N-acetylmuramoyl-L-alanyl-D-glutamate--2,6-diaminopimelate ligase